MNKYQKYSENLKEEAKLHEELADRFREDPDTDDEKYHDGVAAAKSGDLVRFSYMFKDEMEGKE